MKHLKKYNEGANIEDFNEHQQKKLIKLSNMFNRKLGQEIELFILCGYDFKKLYKLEIKIKQHSIFYCPSDPSEVNKILKMTLSKSLQKQSPSADEAWLDQLAYLFSIEE